ncbi:MAG: TIGR04283 family arsenosugar biosynthesis glycosyltransferase [Bdellovibrionota bacterium]|nr:TIGR04283 family arsenosugar biosynthesis glycosyltransferase [Deltaproteobacteria bacterium]
MYIDVIVPVLNEEENIARQIECVCKSPLLGRLIIVDGGSFDQTKNIAYKYKNIIWLETKSSRGFQQYLGGQHAQSEVLLFLHADVFLPESWDQCIVETFADDAVVGGAFQIQTFADPAMKSWANRLLFFADWRSRYTKRPYGDQCIFVRKTAYDKIGGYPQQPLFEDYAFTKKISKIGNLVTRKEKVLVSGRRMQQRPLRSFFWMNVLPFLYKLGVSPDTLKKIYK